MDGHLKAAGVKACGQGQSRDAAADDRESVHAQSLRPPPGPAGSRHTAGDAQWTDEEAAIYAILQLGNGRAVTKYISEINFVSSAVQGDLIEMGLTATRFGRTSLRMRAEVRNMICPKHPGASVRPDVHGAFRPRAHDVHPNTPDSVAKDGLFHRFDSHNR
ncbi:hotdog domain-containing protein [Arthrobacter sp. UYEF36]|uniref:hotdog domain-containing protein n=1 Tax=Arthrobacter sp. UYEF36 TaxID=1756366 RepID=UPI00339B60F0